MIHLGDITKIDGHKVPAVDCVIGGSPCQGLSIAGRKEGLRDARSGLFMEQIRIVKEMREADAIRRGAVDDIRPNWMVWENVPGALSSGTPKGEDFRIVLEEICRIKDPTVSIPRPQKWEPAGCIMGKDYSVAWRIHDAQYYGTPQRRRRIALVADFGGCHAAEPLFEEVSSQPESVSRDSPKSGKAREGTAGAFENGVEVCDRQSVGFTNRGYYTGDVAETMRSQCHSAVPMCASFMGGQGAKAGGIGYSDELSPTLKSSPSGGNTVPDVVYCIQGNSIDRSDTAGCNGKGVREDVAYTLNTVDRPAVAYSADYRNGALNEEISGTLQAHNGGYSHNCINPVIMTMQAIGEYKQSDVSSSCKMRDYKDATDLVLFDMTHANDVIRDCGATCPTLQSRMGTGGNQVPITVSKDVSENHEYIVRRLTPLECERLQGFPDGWTDIPGASDSGRYKALGNSICLPFWRFLIQRLSRQIRTEENLPYNVGVSMASLFDGIGGFPLIWEEVNGKGTAKWASEIEGFCIAVTKRRIG